MPKIFLTRHGQTDWNMQKRYQGHSDIALNATGVAQAEDLRQRMATIALTAAYTSTLQRAYITAETALRDHPSGITAQRMALLGEGSGGIFEGLTAEEQIARYPQERQIWLSDRTHNAPPEGETVLQMQARALAAFDQIMEAHPDPDDTVLIVTHGGLVGVMLCSLMNMNLNDIWKWRTDNCSLTFFELHRHGAILGLFNDTAHLSIGLDEAWQGRTPGTKELAPMPLVAPPPAVSQDS